MWLYCHFRLRGFETNLKLDFSYKCNDDMMLMNTMHDVSKF
jgi:hypothetical protein